MERTARMDQPEKKQRKIDLTELFFGGSVIYHQPNDSPSAPNSTDFPKNVREQIDRLTDKFEFVVSDTADRNGSEK